MNFDWIDRAAAARAAGAGLSRRGFLKAAGAATGGLVLGFTLPGAHRFAQAADAKVYAPNAFLRVAPDNTITVIVNRLEFGQGVHTSLPMLIAEELDADWSQMRGELAPAGDAYKDPAFGIQITGGSGSIARGFTQYREIGARARAMLVAAAAEQWKVEPSQCSTSKGMVLGPKGQKASYGSLAEAAMKQPVPATVVLKEPKQYRYIGKPMRRIDARAKSSGRQQFGIDFTPDNVLTVLVARPPVFGAKVTKFDAAAARAVKGVVDVLEVDLDRDARGVAVFAKGYWPAKQGREALQAEWDTSSVEKVSSAQQLEEFRKLAKAPGGASARKADVSPLAGAAHRISAVYEFPYLAHAPMEPLNCVVDLKDNACTIWAGTQSQTVDQQVAAGILGLKPEQVTINTMMAGGGFGRRAVLSSDWIGDTVRVAKAWRAAGGGGPVKLVWSREDDIRGGYYRPSYVHRADLGIDGKGQIVAWDHKIVGQSIMAGTIFEQGMVKDGVDGSTVEGMGEPYVVPMNLAVEGVKQNVPVLWWRSVGATHTAYVMETLIDEAAHIAKVDPVAYRKKLMGEKHVRHRAALDLAVAKSGYGTKKLPKGRAWGVAVHESFGSVVAYVVEASVVEGVPKLHRAVAGVHCNQPVNPLTIEAQVQGAALMGLGMTLPGAAITLKDGEVEQQNFGDYVVARHHEMPQVEVHVVPSNDPPTGIGEPGLPPLAPAFANAVFRLTGKRLRKLPFDLASA
ncbi:xanthine dehydrogenase family protein molybdopterin-binding subunit [Massilia sp. BSC265]|uniref:xanthine dehydrogenase family protein molybdopterin-binding subunit n=1 Tax=Massilia sp. BSC265 TaxID=1549812 RepID=UPI0004E94959|nr:xanthine dehydrogenase family protein molybdopterin-binding subunit [Massilia sp. BSC265]KFI09064.1 carbon monoxide dehydrogenase [Massilia sp. BSC265]